MKYDVPNRFSGDVQFTADIDCNENTDDSVKQRLAVLWAVENGANLSWADLSEANLSWANLSGADLSRADLSRANLSGANLSRTNLSGADLSRADLSGANLSWADLSEANLSWANLSGADLSEANLSEANLSRADLSGANLSNCIGNMHEIKSMQLDEYQIAYTFDMLQIGCENHTIEEWREFDDNRIIMMDGKRALTFWRKWKDTIFNIIEMSPAVATGVKE